MTYDAPSYPQLDTALCNQDCRDSLSWICWPRYKDKSTHLPLTSGTLWPTQFQPQGRRDRVTKNSPEKATWVCHTRPPVLSCPSIFCTRVCEQRCLVIADQTQPTFCQSLPAHALRYTLNPRHRSKCCSSDLSTSVAIIISASDPRTKTLHVGHRTWRGMWRVAYKEVGLGVDISVCNWFVRDRYQKL